MIVLALRTDKPEAELYIYRATKRVEGISWPAHRQLTVTIHKKVEEILNKSRISLDDIEGLVVYAGPGSFTGLRIGISVANSLAYSQKIPIAAMSGDDWAAQGIKKLQSGHNDVVALPEYDRPPATTPPKK